MCLSCRKGDRVRQFDLFGAPVGVTFNGEYKHKTILGGTITILMLLFFGGSVLLSLANVIINKSYTVDISDTFTQFSDMKGAWKMSTENQTLAGAVEQSYEQDLPDSEDPEMYFRVQFYYFTLYENSTTHVTWVPAVRCKDLYAPLFDSDPEIADEFAASHWICPNVTDIEILRNPSFYSKGNGQSFNMVINTCAEAKTINAE